MARSPEHMVADPADVLTRRSRTAHDVIEGERLLRSMVYAETLRRQPELFEQAALALAPLVDRSTATLGQRLWYALLREPADMVILCMTADDAEGRLLPSNNPFSLLIGETDLVERRLTWSKAKASL